MGKISSHAVAAEVNVLAGGGGTESDRKLEPGASESHGGVELKDAQGDAQESPGDVRRKDEL